MASPTAHPAQPDGPNNTTASPPAQPQETTENQGGNSPTAADAIAPQIATSVRRSRTVSQRVNTAGTMLAGPATGQPGGPTVITAGPAQTSSSGLATATGSTELTGRSGIIGVCALDTKARSKPSRNILKRLIDNGNFSVIIFGDKVILDEQVENWPVCDFLISFFSTGFPLDKAIAYANLRQPYCVNDLEMQKILWDRRLCLRILDRLDVPTPRRVEVNRDGGPVFPNRPVVDRILGRIGRSLADSETERPPASITLEEDGDVLVVDGQKIRKPFVEKPVSGEDHNIHIYYSTYMGGGGRRLFRKINNKSSELDDSLETPRCISDTDGSYVYEEFLQADGAEDIKAYTVGPDYCHAETRKSPVVDGLVKRNPSGKELRFVATLSEQEKTIAGRIARGFGQNVCGFDLLRTDGKCFVIDVNGWSFVKDNDEYYDQCAAIMSSIFLASRAEKMQLAGTQSTVVSPVGGGALPSLALGLTMDDALAGLTGSGPTESTRSGPVDVPIPTGVAAVGTLVGSVGSAQAVAGLGPTSSSSSSLQSAGPMNESRVELDGTGPGRPNEPASQAQWKLKGIVSVIRHADRTPKQKFKFTFHTRPFVDLLKGHSEEVLLLGQDALASVLRAVQQALVEGVEDQTKLRLLETSLQSKGNWPGTKVQIKPMFRKRRSEDDMGGIVLTGPAASASVVKPDPETPTVDPIAAAAAARLSATQIRSDSRSDVTLSRISAVENNLVLDKLQLIIKWGGEPTHSADFQAQDLGENVRADMLLLNKSVLDDIVIASSSERRSTRSARVFARYLLDDDGLADDFITIRKDLLDDSNAAKDEMDRVKKRLKVLLRKGDKPQFQFAWPDDMREPYLVAREVVQLLKFHRKVMHHNLSLLRRFQAGDHIDEDEDEPKSFPSPTELKDWCSGETPELFKERWEKLFDEFCDADKVDPSKISELYDSMKFDALHNRPFLEWVFTPSEAMLDDQSASEDDEEVAVVDAVEGVQHQQQAAQQSYFNLFAGIKPVSNRSTGSSRVRTMSTAADGMKGSAGRQFDNARFGITDSCRLVKMRRLYRLTKVLFDYIGPQEYGMANEEKLEIGLLTSLPLLKEIVRALEDIQASDSAKGIFYFTKESHIYTLLNCIIEGGIPTKIARNKIPELDYLSQIFFELYESPDEPDENSGEDRFKYSIRLSISPGCHTFDPLDVQLDSKHSIGYAPRRSLTAHIDWKQIIQMLRAKFNTVKLPKSFIAINLSEKASQSFDRTSTSSSSKSR